MTQLLLFEPASPAHAASAVEFARAASASASRSSAAHRSNAEHPAGMRAAGQPANPSAVPSDPNPGMHHMGDLARLVLMRYELVAKRRAAANARQAS